MARDPNDPNINSVDQHEGARQNVQQFREMEKRLQGMLSADYGSGGGQFIEEAALPDPVPNFTPREQQILRFATGAIDVAADPSVATPIQQPVEQPQAEVMPPPEGLTDEVVPEAALEVDLGQDRAQAAPEAEVAGVEVPAEPPAVPPLVGMGFGVEDPQERQQILQDTLQKLGVADLEQFRPGAPPSPPEQAPSPAAEAAEVADAEKPPAAPTEGVAGPPPAEPPRGPTRTQPTGDAVQPRMDVGAGPTAIGGVLPDFGVEGESFYRDVTTSQAGIVEAAGEAVDAVDGVSELIIDLLRRLVVNQLRHIEILQDLMDKTDTEDEVDQF